MAFDTTRTGSVLDIHHLEKSFGDVKVLRDINLSIERGDFLVLLGASGCGKSTLLNCIAGLEEVTSGAIEIDGVDMTRQAPKDRDLAMVFQSYALYPTMTVAENITFGMRVRGVPKSDQAAALERVATALQITPMLDRKPSELSGGQRQRVAMGRALVRDPKLFLFDEPLSNLDAKLRVDMRAEIRRLHEAVDAAIVYVTHDQIEAMTLATKICVLDGGVVQQFGTPDQIYYEPANTFVAGFVGAPTMNIMDAEIAGTTVTIGGLAFEMKQALPISGRVKMGFRPEDVATASNGTPVSVISVEHTGSDTFAKIAIGDGFATVRLPARVRPNAGDAITITLDAPSLHFFDPETGGGL